MWHIGWVAVAIAATGCRFHFDVRSDLEPVFPDAGFATRWNDYVRADAAHPLDASGVPCDGSEVGVNACIHIGERLRARVALSSCAQLTATDSLGAFQWACRETAQGVELYTTRLAPERGLSDLIAGTTFRALGVTIARDGDVIAELAPRADLWSNPIHAFPAGAPSLDEPGAIYVVDGSATTDGAFVEADQVALVIARGATLGLSTTGTELCDTAGNRGATGVRSLVCLGGQRFTWIEGRMTSGGVPNAITIRAVDAQHGRIHGVTILGGDVGLLLGGASTSNLARDLRVSSTSGSSVVLDAGVSNTMISNAVLANSGGSGLFLMSSNNVFHQVTTASTVDWGPQHEAGTGNVFTELVVIGAREGVKAGGLNTYHGVTILDAGTGSGEGIWNNGSAGGSNTYSQLLVVNATRDNATGGGVDFASPNNQATQMAVTAPSAFLIEVAGNDNRIGPGLWLGTTTQVSRCRVTGTNNTLDTSCNSGVPPSAPTTVLDIAQELVGGVTADSTNANPSPAPYASITDWTSFSTRFRGWGLDGTAPFPDASQIGPCRGGDSCRIWDVRLRATAPVLRDVNGTMAGSCPSAADAADPRNRMVDALGRAYLVNAFEAVGDDIGNDNGLCETGETCTFAPNIGAYQGEGATTTPVLCAGGNGVTDVRLVAYVQNGG